MTQARRTQIDLSATPYYHCMARCVRQNYLLGVDKVNGRNFDHRKTWLIDKVKRLAESFSIGVCAYAVMSNHYHLVLKVDQENAQSWSQEEVIIRWASVNTGSKAANWLRNGLHQVDFHANQGLIEQWRERLYSISWFMRELNEYIARRANGEDACKGRFWDGRFKSQALLDESALLTCMAYVDLNPIRAGITKTPETSEFTSIQERIKYYNKHQEAQPTTLIELGANQTKSIAKSDALPIQIQAYFDLVDLSGRILRDNKVGYIPHDLLPILERLQINPTTWTDTLRDLNKHFKRFMGRPSSMTPFAQLKGKKKTHGIVNARKMFEWPKTQQRMTAQYIS